MKRRIRIVATKGRPSLLRCLISRYFTDQVGQNAAALAYYLVFSFFPLLIFLSVLLGFLDLPPIIADPYQAFIPIDIIQIANAYLEHISEVKNPYLLALGLVFTIYFTMRAMNCLLCALHRAYRIKPKSSLFKNQLWTFVATVMLMVIIFFTLILLTLGQHVLTFLSGIIPIDAGSINQWNILRFLVLAVVLFLSIMVLYYYVANKKYTLRSVMPGTLAALCSWLIFSIGFAYYVENMGNYSVVYGSIGAVIVLLLWLYCSAITLIMGAEFNHILLERKSTPQKKA
jgi:membrane protein